MIPPAMDSDEDRRWMRLAIDLAAQGQGRVEPNPMVGCVLVRDGQEIGRGFHQQFGGPHAEVCALQSTPDARGATAYLSLEPCCHQGKTPPCTQALLKADIGRVVVATADPFPEVSGQGFEELRRAGVTVDVGILEPEARRLNAPYFKRVQTGRPWVIAKWAMTLDGKLATSRGESRWVSGAEARRFAHTLRGRVDAVIVGALTARVDDPLLTARPSGPRIATRIVFDSNLELPPRSRLAQTARDIPVLLIARHPPADRRKVLESLGCEVFDAVSESRIETVDRVLADLAQRGMTNVLVEGGGELLGSFLDGRHIDEVVAFVSPKLIGGQQAVTAMGGMGIEHMDQSIQFHDGEWTSMGPDICWRGRVRWEVAS